jgi:murein DD-endopeptidase MepM/ murein hydrolase activator NlpD
MDTTVRGGVLHRFLRILFIVFLLAGAILAHAENIYHTVKSGETLFGISRLYGVKEADILFINSLTNANKIYAGQKLRIPSGSISATTVGNASSTKINSVVEYRAVSGDTLYGIARKHGISYPQLESINNFPTNYVLKAGDKIKVPNASAAPSNNPVPRTAPASPPPSVPPPSAQPAASPAAPKSQGASKSKNNVIDKSLEWPVTPKESAYMTGKLSGVVLTGEKTEAVHSVSSGTVVSAGPYRGFGRVVIIKSDRGYDYVYGGCESLTVKKGDRVVAGSEVGKLGIDAVSLKPQLYFMVYQNSKPVDPAKAPRGA